ncbi:MAG: hypothetical protein NC393_01055 [Clostridium sp.]|nr:hypothetical protein [Clostridium sp.]MCM1170690.1 hypothetical protein [Clostridium sp.]MCM1208368.1 hypothetical protein [Ruminococcus sp.]MCM1287092.1 hypothetical protein [Clostridium sp.]
MKLVSAPYTYGYKDKKLNKVKGKIKINKKHKGTHLIVYPFLTDDGLMEIYSYEHLLSSCYSSFWNDIVVLGIASNKDGAMELVVNMIQDIYDSDMDFDIKGFFGM